ncbi:MAG: dihydropteroate synthase, partial [Hyphomicrobiales bacterium]|nr:dihydropteroate synthase [Hyphomicrobiales bacterium]
LNVTPDSFSDGGTFIDPATAIAHAERMVEAGADIIDIGGESTRPGHKEISAEEECVRVLPVIARLVKSIAVPISIDTMKAGVAEAALEAGANIVNDVWGLQRDPDMAGVVARHGATLVAMHNRAEIDADIDIMADIRTFFARTLEIAAKAGIADDRIVLDPGIGFGKTVEQNLDILARFSELKLLGKPLLIGTSRKSTIGKVLDRPVGERLYGTIATNVIAIAGGADIVRVHDIAELVDAVRMTDAVVRRSHG